MQLSSIRRRLLVAFALPVTVLAVMSGIRVSEANDRRAQVNAETSAALAAGGPTTFITAVMDERNITAVELLGLQDAVNLRVASSTEAIERTDTLLAELRSYLTEVEPETRATYDETLDTMESGLAAARASARTYEGPRNTENLFTDVVYSAYTEQIALLHAANDTNIASIDDAELRNRARSVADISSTSDRQSQMTRFVLLHMLNHGDAAELRSGAAQTFALWRHDAEQAVSLMAGDPERQSIVSDFYDRPNQHRFKALVETFLTTGEGDPTKIIAEAADETFPNAADAWDAARASISDRAEEMASAADSQRNSAVVAFLIAMAGSAIAALAAARSFARPLHRLATQARHLATDRLPNAVAGVLATPQGEQVKMPDSEPVETSGIAEIDQVVTALNEVQDRALELAVGQAVMRHNSAESLVNVARRVQGLVGRQIEMIDTVERDEFDPDRLETMYRLDHLATRIRRNSESLVVLAGSQVRRRASFGPPVSVIDVVRAAVAEVEQYERVSLGAIDFGYVAGQASADLAHILAELIENGLAFSPPSTEVVVTARGTGGIYRFSISDSGIGMTPGAIAEANERLAGYNPFGGEATKYLGHHVVGRLASLHGITATVEANEMGGVTANISVPGRLMSEVKEGDPTPELTVSAGASSSYPDLAGSNRSLHEVVSSRRELDSIIR